jgi:hypothetical protein
MFTSSPEQKAEFLKIAESWERIHLLSPGDTLAYLGAEIIRKLLAEVEALEQRIAAAYQALTRPVIDGNNRQAAIDALVGGESNG